MNKSSKHLFFTFIALISLGLLTLYSATSQKINLFTKQLIWVSIAITLCLTLKKIPFEFWDKYSFFFYIASILLLLLTLKFGAKIYGARRWLQIGSLNLQPSEFAKFSTLLFLSTVCANFQQINTRLILYSSLICAIPALLVIAQPDLGTSVFFIIIFISILHAKGLHILKIFLILSPLISAFLAKNIYVFVIFLFFIFLLVFLLKISLFKSLAIIFVNSFFGFVSPLLWNLLRPYQRARILSFFGLEKNWQALQSQIAIGSGGFFGKGFLKGTQKGLAFIPKVHTDFIFAGFAEEFGLIGCILLFGLFFYLFYQMLKVADLTYDEFSRLFIIGAVFLIFSQLFINIGMAMNILPVVGVPLPFFSYGGSNFLTLSLLIALTIAISEQTI